MARLFSVLNVQYYLFTYYYQGQRKNMYFRLIPCPPSLSGLLVFPTFLPFSNKDTALGKWEVCCHRARQSPHLVTRGELCMEVCFCTWMSLRGDPAQWSYLCGCWFGQLSHWSLFFCWKKIIYMCECISPHIIYIWNNECVIYDIARGWRN